MVDFGAFLFNPILWFTVLFAAWAAWRVVRWVLSGGRTPLFRDSRFTCGGFEGANAAVHRLYAPSVAPPECALVPVGK